MILILEVADTKLNFCIMHTNILASVYKMCCTYMHACVHSSTIIGINNNAEIIDQIYISYATLQLIIKPVFTKSMVKLT